MPSTSSQHEASSSPSFAAPAPIGPTASTPSSQNAASIDGQSLWQQLLESTRSKPALGWIRSLDCLHMQNSVMHLAIKPGQREMVRFFGDRQRTQLSQMLSDLAQQPIKVELQLPTRQMLDESQAQSSGGANASNESASPAGSGSTAITAAQRQAVMGLPLVRELMESFDLSLVEVRKHIPGKPAADEDETDDDETATSKRSSLDGINDNDTLDALDGMEETDEFD